MDRKYIPNIEVLALIRVELKPNPETGTPACVYEVLIRNHSYIDIPDQPMCEFYKIDGTPVEDNPPVRLEHLNDLFPELDSYKCRIEDNKRRIDILRNEAGKLASEIPIATPATGLPAIWQACQAMMGFCYNRYQLEKKLREVQNLIKDNQNAEIATALDNQLIQLLKEKGYLTETGAVVLPPPKSRLPKGFQDPIMQHPRRVAALKEVHRVLRERVGENGTFPIRRNQVANAPTASTFAQLNNE